VLLLHQVLIQALLGMQNNTGKASGKDHTFYVSGRIHTVLLKDLEPNTTYYYQ
jgi:hypothetical protein